MIGADRHSLRAQAFIGGDGPDGFDLPESLGLRRDHHNSTGHAIIARAVHLRDIDIESPGAAVPLARVDGVRGFRGSHPSSRADRPVHCDRLQDAVVHGRNQGDKRERQPRVPRQEHVIARIVTTLVRSQGAASRDRVGDLLREQLDHLDRAVAIPRPNFSVTDGQHSVRARAAIEVRTGASRGNSDELSFCELNQDIVCGGINDVDCVVRAVGQQVEPDNRIDEAEIEGRDFLTAR